MTPRRRPCLLFDTRNLRRDFISAAQPITPFYGTAIARYRGRKEAGTMEDQEKLHQIKKTLDEIAAEAVKLSDAIQRLREELERIKPKPSNGEE
ncbi:MAG TPA: hypothetical protein VGY58_09940 [Gemmataceae bacterium]|jgi:hypothetical protein|nr:hypothetical protein [Gemmataceae bacterium]